MPPEDAEGVFGRFVRGGSAAAGQAGPACRSSARSRAPTGGTRAHRGDRDRHPPPGGLGAPDLPRTEARRPALAILGVVPAVLRYRAFRDVWLASLASNAGSWLQIVASGWLILQLTDSPAVVGALALVTRAPAILLSTVAGQLADRFDRRAVGIWTFLLQAVAAGALALITWASGPEVWSIYVLSFWSASGSPWARPRCSR